MNTTNNKPVLFSKTAIILFSIVSSFIGGILFVYNLRALGKKQYIFAMSLYALFAATVLVNALEYAGVSFMACYVPVNVFCGWLLTNVFWDAQIETNDYRKRSVRSPLFITAGIVLFLVLLSFLSHSGRQTNNRSVLRNMHFISVTTR